MFDIGLKQLIMLFGAPSVILLSVVLLGFLLRTVYRTRLARECWNCGAWKVRKSESRTSFDGIARAFLLSPHRCSGCMTRFYRFQFARERDEAPGSERA